MKLQTLALAILCTPFSGLALAEEPPADDRPATVEEFLRPGGRTQVIAHRGVSGTAPENTRVAVRRAIEVGADMVEIDVGLTRDGHVVVLHDATLDRTTDGRGRLAEATLEQVRRLDAGAWFSPEFAGETVPTLAEVLDLVRGRILLNVEIKGEAVTDTAAGGVVDKVLRLVRERRMESGVILSSFSPTALRHARRLDPGVRTASLYNSEVHAGMGPLEVMTEVGASGFNLSSKQLTARILQLCHAHRRPVAVYTVNQEKQMRRLIEMGVDAIFTDHPERLLRVLAERAEALRQAG